MIPIFVGTDGSQILSKLVIASPLLSHDRRMKMLLGDMAPKKNIEEVQLIMYRLQKLHYTWLSVIICELLFSLNATNSFLVQLQRVFEKILV